MSENLIIEHLNLDRFKNNVVDIKNFEDVFIKETNIIKNNENIGDDNYKTIRNKYSETLLNLNLIVETYYDNLNNNINYYNNYFKKINNNDNFNFDFDNIMDIDMSYYCHNKIKEYMFYFDFLSEYYRNLSELKDKKHVLKEEIYLYEFEIKVRIFINDYKNITYSNISKDENDYVIIKFKLNKNDKFKNINLDSYNGLNEDIFSELNIENDEYNILKDNFKWLFNKINIKNDLSIENEDDYFHLITKSNKFKFNKLILNYYIIIVLNLFIKYQKRSYLKQQEFLYSGDSLKLQEINKVINHFNKVFENYYFIFSKTLNIINSIDINFNKVSESQKIKESIDIKNKLIQINKNLESDKLNITIKKENLNYNNKYIYNSNIFFYISCIILIITFILYVSIINSNNILIQKSFSIFVFTFVIIIYILFTYLEKNKFYLENFNNYDLDDTIKKLEQRKKDIDNNYNDDNTNNLDDIKSNFEENKNGIENNYDNKFLIEKKEEYLNNMSSKLKLETEYLENQIKNDTENQKKNEKKEYILKLEKELDKLNNKYKNIEIKEKQIYDRTIELKKLLDEINVTIKSEKNKTINKHKKILEFTNLINIYDNTINDLTKVKKDKTIIRSEQKNLINELLSKNLNYADDIRALNQDLVNKKKKLIDKDIEIQKIISNIELYQLEYDRINGLDLDEQGYAVLLHSESQIYIYQYRKTAALIAKTIADTEKLKLEIENKNTEEQKLSNEIIENQLKIQKELEQSKLTAEKSTYEAKEILDIIKKKIEKIKSEKERKTYEINFIFDINVSPTVIENKKKKNIFENNIVLEISDAILLPLNRIKVFQTIKGPNNTIFIELMIFDIKTYDNKQLDVIQVKNEILKQSKNINSKLRNGKYLRLLDNISIQENKGFKTVTYKVPKAKFKIEKTNDLMNEILININLIIDLINNIEKKDNIEKTYYDEIHPNLKLELKKYMNFDNNSKDVENILNNNINTSLHDYTYNYNIIYLLLNLSLLISITFILHSYFSNFKSIILLLFIITFIILIVMFLLNITKNIRTNAKNKYWGNIKINEYNI